MSRRFVLALLALLVGFALAGVGADRYARAHQNAESRADAMARAGKLDGAEKSYWGLLEKGPVTVPLLIAFLDAHDHAVVSASAPEDDDVPSAGPPASTFRIARPPAVDEASIDALLARADLAPDVALIGQWWRGVARGASSDDLEHQVRARADADPPGAWTNHQLAKFAIRRAQLDEAATRFLREASYFPDRGYDAGVALDIWIQEEDWDRVDDVMRDPRVRAVAPPYIQVRSAIRAHDWLRALRAYPACLRPAATKGMFALAAVAALAWGVFCARLGHVRERTRFRLVVYVLAFALGVASVALTLAIVALEEGLLAMTESGNPVRDALYFTFGVGLREEASKLVFFLPLLPILRKRGTRLDVLVCGALVGLGFASEENLEYLAGGDLSTSMARFLTANFLHVSMTAILAAALDEMLDAASPRRSEPGWPQRDGEGGSLAFSRTLLLVSVLHGAYDFCLSSRAYGDLSLLAMAVFIFLARWFLHAVSWARAQERAADARLLETFAAGMVVVTGASFVYASERVGPIAASRALAEGLLGLALIVLLFVQELRRV